MKRRTARTVEGRLFPALEWDHGWTLSLQADAAGYACSPRERLPFLEDYETVEAVICGPFPGPVDPRAMDLPASVLEKFVPLGDGAGVSIGCGLGASDVEAVMAAIAKAASNPNAGVPEGRIGWSGRQVFHGTTAAAARAIADRGVSMAACGAGYFGRAYYVAEDGALARSNYADFAGEAGEAGAVVTAFLAEAPAILDLRNAADWERWRSSGLEPLMGRPDFPALAVSKGVEGVYDRSVGGLAIYDPAVLSGFSVVENDEMTGPKGP